MEQKIIMSSAGLVVPDNPTIPFIEGDGIGADIWAAAVRVFDHAVMNAYKGKRRISWKEVLAGEKAYKHTGQWLPRETQEALRSYVVSIKGPLTTPIGGGFRSLNVTIRQLLDLYVCLRPVKYYPGIPSPVKRPELIDMVVFRENTEDVYAGYELKMGEPQTLELIEHLERNYGWYIRQDSGIGIKPVSETGSKRLIRAAIKYAIDHHRQSVTLVHKGNIMKYTEGAFRQWGYEVAREEFGDKTITWDGDDRGASEGKIIVKDVIADAFLQQILTRPAEYDVIATLNLNGDYISDALAAQVGGIGIAPGANINYLSGTAVFEATHGTAPKYAGLNKVNPSSLILSGMLMFEYLGWNEAAALIDQGISGALEEKQVTYDLARLMDGATEVSTSAFGDSIIAHM